MPLLSSGSISSSVNNIPVGGVEEIVLSSTEFVDISGDHANATEIVYAYKVRRVSASGSGIGGYILNSGAVGNDTYSSIDGTNDRLGFKFEATTGSPIMTYTAGTDSFEQNETASVFVRIDGVNGNHEIVIDGVQVATGTGTFTVKAAKYINSGDGTFANSTDMAVSGFIAFSSVGSANVETGLSYNDFFDGSNNPIDEAFDGTTVNGFTPDVAFDTVASWNNYAGKVTGVVSGSVEFSWAGDREGGIDSSGRAYVVIPSGSETVYQPVPAQTTDGGNVINGAMKNPQRTTTDTVTQGFDERLVASNYDGAKNETSTVLMTAGDVLVKSVADQVGSYVSSQEPFASEFQVCHAVSSALGPNDILGPAVTYSGHSYPEVYTVDWTALLGLFQNRDASAISLTLPSYATVMSSLNKEAPMLMYNTSAGTSNGYERMFPADFHGVPTTAAKQYGRYIAWMIGTVAIGLHYDQWSTAEKTAILKRLVRFGIDWGFPAIDSTFKYGPNGGHNSFHQFPTILALIACGRAADVPTFLEDSEGGNWAQPFEVTNSLIASDFSQHTNTAKPFMWYEQTLSTQPGGTVVRVPSYGPMDNLQNTFGKIPVGALVMRKGAFGGVHVATVTTETGVNTGATTDIPIDAQPDVAFTSGDVIWFEAPPVTVYDGAYDWAERGGYGPANITGNPDVFSPSESTTYRDLQEYSNQVLSLAAIGYMNDNYRQVLGYAMRANAANTPSADNDYFRTYHTFAPDGWEAPDAIYAASGEPEALAYGTASVYEGSAPSAISIYHIAHPSATVSGSDDLQDGLVIGVVGDLTKQAVKIAGVATGGDNTPVEVRVLKNGDSSVVQDWTHLGWIDTGAFEGTIELPIGDDWYNFEVRSVRGGPTAAPTERVGVGYKIMILGQSQVSIWGDDNAATSLTMTAAYENTGSFYKWQAYNESTTPVAESLTVIDNTSVDGPRAFIEQARALGVTAPIMLVRESVNGTGIVEMFDDANSGRNISDLTDKTDKYGKDFSAVIEWWDTANASPLNGDTDIESLFGIADGTSGAVMDSALNEYLLPGYKIVVQPSSRHSTANGDGVHAVQKVDYANGTPKLPLTVGWPLADFQTTASTGGPHPLASGDGNLFAGYRMALGFVEAIGGTSFDKPYITGTAERSADGTQITIPITMSNSGTLATEGSEVSGFYVSEDSGTNFYSRNSKHEDGTSADGSFGFQATVSGSNIVLTRDSGTWATNTSLQVHRRYHLEHYEGDADEQIVVDGEIYETGVSNIKGPGLPVHGNTSGGVWDLGNNANKQAWVITSVTQAASSFTADGYDNGGSVRATDYGMSTPTFSELTMSGWVYVNTLPASTPFRSVVFALYNAGSQSALVEIWDNGTLEFSGYDGSGTELFRKRSNTSVITTGQWYHVWVSADVDSGGAPVAKVFLDQTEITAWVTDSAAASGTYTFRAPNRMMLYQRSGPTAWLDGAMSEVYVDNVYRTTPASFHSGGSPIDLSAFGAPYYYLAGTSAAAFTGNATHTVLTNLEDGLLVEDGTLTKVTGPT